MTNFNNDVIIILLLQSYQGNVKEEQVTTKQVEQVTPSQAPVTPVVNGVTPPVVNGVTPHINGGTTIVNGQMEKTGEEATIKNISYPL